MSPLSTPGGLRQLAAGLLLPGFVGTTLPPWLAERLRNGLAGVCLFGVNIVSRGQLRELTDEIREANPNAIIAIDEEGGDVTRLYHSTSSPYPGNALLGRIDDVEQTEFVARIVGWELRLAGCNLDLAPDVDINSNPDNPVIGVRSFGAEPMLVARHAAAWVRGLESTGTAASAKHFPGHGDTAQDSHLALPVVDLPLAELRRRELLPFAAAIAAGSRTVMTSHILLPQIDPFAPATFSRIILQDLLRRELGFTGVIVTDALDMVGASGSIGIPEAAVRAVAAGCDLLCIGTDNTDEQLAQIEAAIVAAVEDGRIERDVVRAAYARTLALGQELRADAERIPIPEYVTAQDEPIFDDAASRAAFDVQPGVVVEKDRLIVAIETVANIAVGHSPWGAAAAGADVLEVREGQRPELPSGAQIVIVGKDNHRRAWTREFIDSVRQSHPSTLVVDMGWPGDERLYADVATFGASRHVGRALLAWLEGVQQ
jgi:beta-N-acetylhexosaminidase